MKNTFSYTIGESLYINLTNRCSNDCDFCIRNHSDGIEDYYLWLDREPSSDEIISSIKSIKGIKELVFCGFGEPLYAYDTMKEVGLWAKAKGLDTRLNTNGQAKHILGRDVSIDIATFIDTINISLNASSAKKYNEVCHSQFNEAAYFDLLDFSRACVKTCKRVVLSVVDSIGSEEVEKCRIIAKKVGATLRVRELI